MGNPGKRAVNTREPDPDYLTDLTPPEWMPEGAKIIWREEAPKFRKARLLTVLDVAAFADLCVAQWDYRRAVLRTGENDVNEENDGLNPWAIVKSMSSKRMNGLLAKFGGTPVDRTRVEINPQASLFGDDKPKPDPSEAFFH